MLSGFLVFLIALPLCLAIADASKYPPIMGIWTAVLGGIITTFISNSQMTIKGPAAGMIVIVAGAVGEFQKENAAPEIAKMEQSLGRKLDDKELDKVLTESGDYQKAYRMAIGLGVISGLIQIVFGLIRAGVLADMFPISAVHGLLASIGVIIMFKQAYKMIGLNAPKSDEAIHAVLGFPAAIPDLNPTIAAIGIPCLVLLFALTFVKHPLVKKIPGQVIVLFFAIPMGYILTIENKFLVNISSPLANIETAFALPDFSGVFTAIGIKYLILFALIGTLESLLSAKAVDLLDPKKRKTDLNRDLLAVGVGNTAASAIGGLPMISEIVRSKANIDNGAQSKFSNMFHGLFLLLAVLFLANALHRIPLAALGAMLVFTGYRLAHPREFMKALKIGPEQLAIFLTTIIVVLYTDLLIGIAAGVVVKILTLFVRGISPTAMARLDSTNETRPDGAEVIHVSGPIIFSNWVRLKNRIALLTAPEVLVNVSKVSFIDHTSIEKLHELEMDFKNTGRQLHLEGVDALQPVSSHNLAARKQR